MNYILYFDGCENNTFFYNSIEELLSDWGYKSLKTFINDFKNDYTCLAILKIDTIIWKG